jgi:hypothetical protein
MLYTLFTTYVSKRSLRLSLKHNLRVNRVMSQDKKKTLLEYTKPSQPKTKDLVDTIIEWFIEEKKKKFGDSSGHSF